MAPDYPQNYYGTSSHQNPQQQYANYQTPRNTSTGGNGQYSSSTQPAAQPFQSYSTQAHGPSGTSYNLSDYGYGSTTYGASSGTSGASRNTSSADLQNLAYASVVHDSVQRANAQSNSTNQGFSASPSQHGSYTSTSYSSYGQPKQPRPKSVNALTGRSTQHPPAVDSRQLNPSGLPLPKTGYRPTATPSSSSHQRTITSPPTTNAYSAPQATQQHLAHTQDHQSRALPNLSQPVATSAAYQWTAQHHTSGDTSRSRDFETVDPTQVYDPWPEIQRKREAARAAKALEERAQAELERLEREKAEREAEEARKVEEARLAEERRKAEEEAKAEQQRVEEERRKEAEVAQKAQEQRQKKANTKSKMSKASAAAAASSSVRASPQDVESQMRALMAQMRELNNDDPALLARIWEEERRAHQSSQAAPQAIQSPTPSTQQVNRAVGQKQAPSTQQQAPATTHSSVAQTPTSFPPRQPSRQPPPSQPPQQTIPKTRQFPKRKPPKGTTSWPPDKIEQISKAASDWLNAIPENHDKHVSPQEISDILNGNPKYIELCEWLEFEGLKLERAAFARALLSAVPDINKPSQSQAPANHRSNGHIQQSPTSGLNSTGQPSHQNHQAPSYSEPPVNRVSTVGEHLAGGQYSYPYPPPEHAQLRSPYFVGSTGGTPNPIPQSIPTPPPQVPVAPMPYARHDHQNSGSRQGSSQREDSSKPVTKADAARKRNFSEMVDLTLLSDDEEPSAKKVPDYDNDIAPAWAAPPDSAFQSHYLSNQGNFYPTPLPTMVQIDDRMKNMDVVQPVNRKYALRRSTYEVKSIARDVLLATGKHPEMRPLNGHLDILRESFKKVDNAADLSTLRWDLIDPGDPPPEALKPITVVELDDEDADDEEDDVPKEEARPRQPPPVTKPTPAVPERPTGGVLSANISPLPSSTPMPKKRPGRPPKAGHLKAAGAVGAQTTPSSRNRDRDPASSTPATLGTPNSQHTAMATGYAAFRTQQIGPDGTPLPKKKGRPVGWRKAVHSKEAQAATPQPASVPRPKSGARTAKTPHGVVIVNSRSPSVASVSRTPATFSVYKCQWENCAAELHNLETLKKHVSKFHKRKNAHNKWACFWDGCQENERTLDPRTGKPNGFSTEEDFNDHMDFAHVGPNAWKLGDGHAGGLSESHDSASEAYLSDSRTGRKVTPLIAAPSKERLELAIAAAEPARRGPGRPKLGKSDEQKARDAQAALEQKKKSIGPGIDRGGARLANDKRRLGFLDDEDFEEVISDDD